VKDEIALQLLRTLGVIFATAGGLLLIQWAIRGKNQRQDRMGTRFVVEVFVLAFVFIPAYLGGPWLLAAAMVLGCLCTAELYGTFESGGDRPFKVVGIGIGLICMIASYLEPGLIAGLLPALIVLYWVLRFAAGPDPESILAKLRRTCFGIIYPFVCLAFFVEIGRMDGGFGYVILYYGLAEVNDSAAYLIGSSIGRRKIFPRLSPNKTVEGVVGGILTTILIAFVLRFAVPGFGAWELIGAGILIAAAGTAGDLFASRLKRRVGVKDYGEAIPTQGGVLDVYDAFAFVAPVFYYYLLLIGA
jgi:phosphatidate cytidylyltransferase